MRVHEDEILLYTAEKTNQSFGNSSNNYHSLGFNNICAYKRHVTVCSLMSKACEKSLPHDFSRINQETDHQFVLAAHQQY
jgi:hypothetical protein